MLNRIAILALAALLPGCLESVVPKETATRIHWDTWGVPHIYAVSDEEFFLADGWAQMHAHANTVLRLYGTSRGRAAEYWGERHLANDRMVHTLDHPAQAERMWQRQNPELRRYITAFVKGMNAYAVAHPDAIGDENRVVLPVTETDVNLHAQFVVNTRFVAGRELGMSRRYADNGSNTMAIGPARSAGGHAMLIQNPHLPWHGEFLFFEKHLVNGDQSITGVHLVGLPGFAIGFNEKLGWSHTNNTIDNADLYELELTEGGYRFDGGEKPFEQREVYLKVRAEDGALREEEFTVLESVHGPVVSRNGDKALALRFVGRDSVDSLLQWWRMANAKDFESFESALKMQQVPFWNVMYADREGNIFYLFNGQVPVRQNGGWDFWQAPVPGNDPANLWAVVHGYDDLPKLLNPATGWLQNANDPPWTSTIPPLLDAGDFPAYTAPRGMGFRPQRAARMILEDDSISFDELVAIKHDTRMELADRVLDDLFSAVGQQGSQIAKEAAEVLGAWDRNADIDSRGAVLFQFWALNLVRSGPGVFAKGWDENDPVNTPDGLADPAAMVAALEQAAERLLELHGRLDVAWGEFNRIRYNGHDLPANGSVGELGMFRVAAARPSEGKTQNVVGGDSWVGVIEFGETARAKVLLSYGNATQPGSPHYGDQLELFSRKELRDAWRSEKQLAGHITRTEALSNGTFEQVDAAGD